MSKRAIPTVPRGTDQQLAFMLNALKENAEIVYGQRVAPLEQLSSTATTAEIITKINEIIARLQ